MNAYSLIIFATSGFDPGFELQTIRGKTKVKSAKELDDYLKAHREITEITMGTTKRTDSIDIKAAEDVFKKYEHIRYTIFKYRSPR